MAEVASAYVSLLPSARGFGGQIESEVGGQVDQAGVSLGRRLGAGLGRAAAAAVATLGGVALAAGTVGIRTAAQLEQAEIGFTTMLGSGEKAQAFLSDLAGFAAKTPFELPELQTAASSLVSVGVSADKVIPIMTSLGNATSGMGTGSAGIQRATVALQQMNAAGRITGEDLNQLRDAGIPVYDLLAAATGKSVEAVAELAQKGKLGREELEQLMGALESGAGLERFTGLMEVQSQSLTGMWSTLQDTFSMGMADAVQPLIPLIKDGLGGASAFVTAQMPALKAGLADVVVAARGLYDLLANGNYSGLLREAFGWEEDSPAVDRILDIRDAATGLYDLLIRGDYTGSLSRAFGWEEDSAAVDMLFDLREGVQSLLSGNGPAELGAAFGSIGASMGTLVPVVQEFLSQMPSVTSVVTVGATALGFLADHSDLLVKAMPLLVGALIAYRVAQLAANIVTAASPIFRIMDAAAARAQTVAVRDLVAIQRAEAASRGVSTAVTTAGTTATNVNTASTMRNRVATLAAAASAKVVAAGTALVTAAQWAWNAALTANPIGIVIVAIAALVAALVWFFTQTEVGQKIVTAAWSGIKAAVSAVADWFTSTIPALWSSISTWTRGAWDGIVAFFKAIPGRIVAFFLNWSLPGLLVKHWSSIKAGAVTGFNAVVEYVRGFPGRVVSALGNLGSILLGAGRDILAGFLSGLRAGFENVKDFVGGIGSWIADHKGPKAYDLALLRPAGGWIMTGLRAGIEKEIPALRSTLERVTGAIEVGVVQNRNLGNIGVGSGANDALASAGSGVHIEHMHVRDEDEVPRRLRQEARRNAALTNMRRVAAGVA